ncbi:MAG: hypothetical protein ABSE21_10410 [Bryobacteraceae bacterium]|jgi:hypothetical protein
MADFTSWCYSRAYRFVFAVLFVLVGSYELISRRHAAYHAIGMMWLVVGIGWGIGSQFAPEESRRQYFVGLTLCSLLLGASSIIAAGTDTFEGLGLLFVGVLSGISALRTKEVRPTLLPPDEPGGLPPSSGSEPAPGRGISAQ